jgi:hypothetical protein
MAGGTVDPRAMFHDQASGEGELDLIRHELDSLPADAPYVEWGRWFLADRTTRTIAPGFSILPADAGKLGTPLVR